MSALDRVMNYSAREGVPNTPIANNGAVSVKVKAPTMFVNGTEEEKFLEKIHNQGYKLYTTTYIDSTGTVITEEEYNQLDDTEKLKCTFEFQPTELLTLLRTYGNQEINAIAGAGKTSALVFKVMYDIITGEATTYVTLPSNGTKIRVVDKVWVCTFLKSGAEELKSELLNWQYKLGYSSSGEQVIFSTLDAEFLRCLKTMGITVNIGSDKQLESLLIQAINSCNIRRPDDFPLTKEDYKVIGTIVKYCRGRLTDKYSHPSMKDYGLMPNTLDVLINQYATLRTAANIVDFEEVQELLYGALYVNPNPKVQDHVANRFNYIYIDEFQDTSQMQYAILKFYARGHLAINTINGVEPSEEEKILLGAETKGKMVAIGDPSQCIYSFKGSDSKILTELFDKDFRPCMSTLSVNWRCPANILNPIVPSIHMNADSANQAILPAKEGGIFHCYVFGSFRQMIDYLQKDITEDLDNNMNVAILCRTNYDGAIPAFMLESMGNVNFSISGESMTLATNLPRKLMGLTSLLYEKASQNVKDSLEFLVPRHSRYSLKVLMDTLRVNNKSIWDLPIEDINYSCPWLTAFIQKITPILKPYGVRQKDREFDAMKAIYDFYINTVFTGSSIYSQSARAYLETLKYLLENQKVKDLYAFVETMEHYNERLKARIGKNKSNVQIVTVHESKGKEYDSVYVWNDTEGVFPSNKCNMESENDLAEERRVHYIACTRAKKKSSIYTLNGKVGLFVREMNCRMTNPVIVKKSI